MKQDRKVLEQNLIDVLQDSKLKAKKRDVNDIKSQLANYDIIDAQSWLNDPATNIPSLDVRELFLFNEQVFKKVGDLRINPDEYFTSNEAKESRQFSGMQNNKENEISFPLTIQHAQIIGNNAYMITLDIQTINALMNNQLLIYDFNLQREAEIKKRNEKVILEPKLYMNNVKEITEHLLNGTLVPTVHVWNAQTRSSETGSELIFDPKNLELTITKGTRIAIVDGMHRTKSIQNALLINPDLHFNFPILLTNYSTRLAQQYQAQLSKASPISKTRIQELEANRLSDMVVQQLKSESDLQGHISQTNRIHSLNKEYVTYNVLADTIDEQFKMESRANSLDVGDFLSEFFNVLIGENTAAFITDIEETRKSSLINDNNMFCGYIVLARRLFEADIRAKEVRKYIKNIDFSRDNSLWKKIGVLDDKGNLLETNKVRKTIKEYFEKIDIEMKV